MLVTTPERPEINVSEITKQVATPLLGAEQVSLSIDFRRAAAEGVAFDGIQVPAEMRDATPVRQAQFLAGRFCALEALRRLSPWRQATEVGRGRRGAPVWPAGVVGSITHTEGFVSAAVASTDDARGIGIDSERIVTAEQAQSVSMQVAWPSELAHARQAGFDRLQALTLVFSAKESIFKCLYPLIGEMFYYHDVRVIGLDAAARLFRARVVKTLSPEFPAETSLEGRFAVSGSLVHTSTWLPAYR